MTLPPVTFEYMLAVIGCGVGCALGCFLAARRNLQADYAFIVREVEAEVDQMDLLEHAEAVAQRNEVLDGIADRNSGWLALAAAEMARLEPGVSGIGEDFRRILKERGVPDPVHPNAVGAFIGTMVRRGVLVPTGEYRAMRDAKANGRRSPVYSLQKPEAA